MKSDQQAISEKTGNTSGFGPENHGFAFTHTGLQIGDGAAAVDTSNGHKDPGDEFNTSVVLWKTTVKGSRLVNYRKSHDQMASELEQQMALPYSRVGLVGILDKIERLGLATGAAVPLPDLLGQGEPDATNVLNPINDLLRLAIKDGLLEKGRIPGKDKVKTYTLLDKGRRLLKKAREARLALWKINPCMCIGQICAIVEAEEDDCVELYLNEIIVTTAINQVVVPIIRPQSSYSGLMAATSCWAQTRPVRTRSARAN